MLRLTFGTAALLGSLALLPAAQAQDANPATCVADDDPRQWDIAYRDNDTGVCFQAPGN